jgi:phosphomevalonate kinase
MAVVRGVRARAPGKLLVLGEYAVLEPGEPAIVTAVDRYAEVVVRPTRWGRVWSSETGRVHRWWIRRGWEVVGDRGFPPLVGAALTTAFDFLRRQGRPTALFRLDVDTRRLVGPGGKLGMGSSAAAATAIVGATLGALGSMPTVLDRRAVFPLAAGAHRTVQGGLGSGVDVAASVYGGFLLYRAGGDLVQSQVEPVNAPNPLPLLVVDTGHPVATSPRIALYRRWARTHEHDWRTFLRRSRANVYTLRERWLAGDDMGVKCVAVGRRLLLELGRQMGVAMETPELRRLARAAAAWGGAAKPSGAGGGDIGIAVLPTVGRRQDAAAGWSAAGLSVVEVRPGAAGLTVRSW